MGHTMYKKLLLLCLLTDVGVVLCAPKLTVVIVVDQFGYTHLNSFGKHFSGGLARLLHEGTHFSQARYPYAITATATGHTSISTGARPADHGIVGNGWYDETGRKEIACDNDASGNASVFSPDGVYPFGKSSRNMTVDGVSDQIRLYDGKEFGQVYAISLKSRTSVAMAAKMGKALWFDDVAGRFTSSKAYFDKLPDWVDLFNAEHAPKQPVPLAWKLSAPADSDVYDAPGSRDDASTEYTLEVQGQQLKLTRRAHLRDKKKPYYFYERTPASNKLVLDAARACVREHIKRDGNKNALLWLSLSSTDKIGHLMGPASIATMDLFYHLDTQLDSFIEDMQEQFGEKEVLFVLTGDHGGMPIVEQLAARGMRARRLFAPALIAQMNAALAKQGVTGLVTKLKAQQFYFDKRVFRGLAKRERKIAIGICKGILEHAPGVKRVVTPRELRRMAVQEKSDEWYYKEQLFAGRTGDLICMVHPYTDLSNYRTGTGHTTPYEYNTHVPLCLYQPGVVGKKVVSTPVSMLQLAPTLASLLGVPRPSAAREALLPGV